MKRILIMIMGILIFLLTGVAVYLVAFDGKSSIFLNKQTQTTTPIPTPTIRNVGKYILFPDTYSLSDSDLKILQDNQYQTIFILSTGSASNNQSFGKATNAGLIVENVAEESSYKKCQIADPADNDNTANKSSIVPFTINKDDCSNSNKVAEASELNCSLTDTKCQNVFIENVHSSNYLYISTAPFANTFTRPQLSVETKNGITITYWQSNLPPTISQKSYSLEYLNTQGKRIYATGRSDSSTNGDFFLPSTQLPEQKLTAKLRIWYTIGSQTLTIPVIYETSINYKYEANSNNSTSTSTPVQMSWIPDWGMTEGIESVTNNPKKWNTISPVWFTANKDGTLATEKTLNTTKLTSILKANNIKLIPTISLFDADILQSILRNNLEKHVNEILKTVQNNNYAGIDLDYESTYVDDKELLTQFVTLLAEKLHANKKVLSFTAIPKIDDRKIYAFLPQTHQAQDWKALGAVVDEFRIMAYDYTGQGSKQPGPLSPYAWNELLIQYATANMPASKVVLALPLYAHGWPKPNTSNLAGSENNQNLSSGLTKNTISPQHDDIEYIKGHSTYYRETYDTWYKEVRAEFKYNGTERVMYYLNKKAVDERLDLAKKYGIKGVCYWRIGGERL